MTPSKSTSKNDPKAQKTEKSYQRAGFFRRLAAMVYDGLVAAAVGMLSGLTFQVLVLILFQTQVLENRGFENYMDYFQSNDLLKLTANVWVGLWIGGFFLWFWKNGGQTLGMRAWRLKIYNLKDQKNISYARLLLRLITAFLGLGTLLVLLDVKNKQSLQDRIAQTEVLHLSKEANDHKSW
ncbi:RDD family protein [Brumicola pallidula]|uniref:RDD domain containing protein n=1 Tax=Brumicola pallidula DSM 14239 = ACAM 615 TaxID=1121922 RepID=K6ZJI5_9ALTE|nr:RDD family protein [Glaciecola pallidula]GAC30492.1 RDD domain containing protein [Glaciecola pallidula DSM 14239 = ACAM 615]